MVLAIRERNSSRATAWELLQGSRKLSGEPCTADAPEPGEEESGPKAGKTLR